MKRHLLLGALLFGSILGVSAQGANCAGADEIFENGTFTVPAFTTGTNVSTCWGNTTTYGGGTIRGQWYSFTPTANGVITINAAIDANSVTTTDTRLSIFSGTCAALACYNGNDDIDVDAEDYRSYLQFEVSVGETYYIMWDNYWVSTGFDFEFTFEEATCFSADNFVYTEDPTYTTTSIGWDEPALNATAPAGYQYEYGPSGFTPGEGITVDVTDTVADMTGLTAGTDYDFYIRTNCGDGDYSIWNGPITFTTAFEPADLTYENSFEDTNLNGWFSFTTTGAGGSWRRYAYGTTLGTPDESDYVMGVAGATVASDVWLFSRPINVPANTQLNISYYAMKYAAAGAGGVQNYSVNIGTSADAEGVIDTIETFEDVQDEEFVEQSLSYFVAEAGVYYLSFEYTGDVQAQANFGYIFLDTVTVTGTAGTSNAEMTKLAVYPNPATNVVNISNSGSALISGVNVTDINGRTVKALSFDGVANAQVNVSDLATGVYMMTINSDKGSVTKKVVKN